MGEEITRRALPFVDAAPEEACLVVIYGGPVLGQRFALTGDTTIGRDPSSTIPFDLFDVSRQHARLFLSDSGWTLSDLGSMNGTQVNGTDIRGEFPLRNGDLIRVGGAILKYIAGGNVESLFHEEIYRLTIYDGLTGIANKRYFLEFLDREVARALRYGARLSLALLDIDHFKTINDRHGHPAGDAVLQRIADVIGRAVRREQLFARVGGEELALVMPEVDEHQVECFCDTMRRTIENERFAFDEGQGRVTISIGYASMAGRHSRDELIDAADRALYAAKRAGRNTIAGAPEEGM
ncbi:MAG TPA: GGDEF domain-containing protein [Thermoanaerobaculia bacterium]|nr:GGDEF domain-containing protein [Thermoanaerobaculia bacterium]